MQRILCLCLILCDHNALAQRKAIRLDDSGPGIPLQKIGKRLFRRIKHFITRGRDAIFFHQVFRENLAAFNLCRQPGGAECADACRLQRIHHACRQRVVRRDKDEIYLMLFAEGNDAFDIHCGNCDALRIARNTAVAGRAVNLLHTRAFHQLADQRMLAPTTADHKNFHPVSSIPIGFQSALFRPPKLHDHRQAGSHSDRMPAHRRSKRGRYL
jgi:hypothetical protein